MRPVQQGANGTLGLVIFKRRGHAHKIVTRFGKHSRHRAGHLGKAVHPLKIQVERLFIQLQGGCDPPLDVDGSSRVQLKRALEAGLERFGQGAGSNAQVLVRAFDQVGQHFGLVVHLGGGARLNRIGNRIADGKHKHREHGGDQQKLLTVNLVPRLMRRQFKREVFIALNMLE